MLNCEGILSGECTQARPRLSNALYMKSSSKVYDVFRFFNELDLLELRFQILDPYVDYFVLVEAPVTFSGLSKPLYYQENKERFAKWNHKIIHHVVPDTPNSHEDPNCDQEILQLGNTSPSVPHGQIHWLREFYQLEHMRRGLAAAGLTDDDICFVSDLDEIWNPEMKLEVGDVVYKPRQLPYMYFLNNRSDEDWLGWCGTIATRYKNIKDACLNHLKTDGMTPFVVVEDGGWHFSFTGGAEGIKTKLESYGHQEFNNPTIKSNLQTNLTLNRDYRGRNLNFWVDETSWPQYLKDNREKYVHLLR